MLMRRKGLHTPWSEFPMCRSCPVLMNPPAESCSGPAVVEFGAAAQSRDRCRFQRSCLCTERGWNSFWPFSQNMSGIYSAGGYLSGQINPVSLALIRLEGSSAGVLADIARKGEQRLKKILRNIPAHYSPPLSPCSWQSEMQKHHPCKHSPFIEIP